MVFEKQDLRLFLVIIDTMVEKILSGTILHMIWTFDMISNNDRHVAVRRSVSFEHELMNGTKL